MSVSKRDALANSIARTCRTVKTNEDILTTATARSLMEKLENFWQRFVDCHLEVMEVTGVAEVAMQESLVEPTENIYTNTKALLYTFLERQDAQQQEQRQQRQQSQLGSDTVNIVNNPAELKLPRIELPKFNGDYTNWTSFHDLFSSLIDSNARLSGSQKLHYLKSNLESEAFQLIRTYQVTDANYTEAWLALKNRYNNKRIIVNSHMKILFGQTPLIKESASALRKLVDVTTECIRSLNVLGLPTDEWNAIVLYLVVQKLDPESHRQWELSLQTNELPQFSELVKFIETRCRSLEAVGTLQATSSKSDKKHIPSNANSTKTFMAISNQVCHLCEKEQHSISSCPDFIRLNYEQRLDLVRKRSLCFNCLRSSHTSRQCKSSSCRKCGRRHHSLLHYLGMQSAAKEEKQPEITSNFGSNENDESVLLATAMVKLKASNSTYEPARVLLDTGSQASFITENCVQRLKLKRQKCSILVSGIGGRSAGHTLGTVNLIIKSCHDDSFILEFKAFILKNLTNYLPNKNIEIQSWPQFSQIKLADPSFHKPGKIDLLIGASSYGKLLLDGMIPGKNGSPTAQNTSLGWILSGPVISRAPNNHIVVNTCQLESNNELDETLRKFWQIEECSNTRSTKTKDEEQCENIYNSTHFRNKDGRYVVQLPFKGDHLLGDSRFGAIKRFLQLERRFEHNLELKHQYIAFIEEYLALGHMQRASSITCNSSFYLPHHGVIKADSATTKLRVVFDASAKSSNGFSLNEKLLIGPKLQDDLVSIVMRFRKHKIAFTSDIAKMYRQVLVDGKHRNYQRIIWRKSPTEPLEDYQLNTVTYGMASASYLAIRSLQQVALDESKISPAASQVIISDFYVDDLMSGSDDISTAMELQKNVIAILETAGFQLRKWASNSTELLKTFDVDEVAHTLSHNISIDESETPIKALGLQWFPSSDEFGFKVSIVTSKTLTKRSVMSDIARLFDPMGWLSPCIIMAKIFMQQLWTIGINWDDDLPPDVATNWLHFQGELRHLEMLKIKRWYGSTIHEKLELHGFCDASELAYAAVVYLRTINQDNNINMEIVFAKTKVSPIKQISLPRLELCGALLLARIMEFVKISLKLDSDIESYYWTDSTIVLGWLSKIPGSWKTFVANRVSEIQLLTKATNWKHISSKENPADVASRGIYPALLQQHSLWWHGPSWLIQDKANWPNHKSNISNVLPEKKETQITILVSSSCIDAGELMEKYSSLATLKRVTAYLFRFIQNCKLAKNQRTFGYVTTKNLQQALNFWLVFIQQSNFKEEIICCRLGKRLPSNSKLSSLNPFLDTNGILRVGGRLAKSSLSYDRKHPIILPNQNHLTQLIISDIHFASLHGGVQLMLQMLRQNYWIVGARSLLRKYIHGCMVCFRQKTETCTQLMGDLPSQRVTPTRPFLISGVDFAGPIALRMSKGRCRTTTKGYVSVFICFATRAMHLEVVNDLTTDSFLAAFRRFISRRGPCAEMHSDCGTNFVGAKRKLDELTQILIRQQKDDWLCRNLVNDGTNWILNPPGAPHFGGLWEAGVKSMKQHMKKIVGSSILTFEEMSTVMAQIECCLNSRPISPLSDDINDFNCLTPGHFLVGDSLKAVPEPNILDIPMNRLARWQMVQQISQQFWSRWQNEYISRLQQRPKWCNIQPNIGVGQLVVIKDENLPPAKWALGRIMDIHPGSDGLVRVVSIKYAGGVMKRPVHKIALLPFLTSNTD